MTDALGFSKNFGYEPWTGNLNALNDAFGCLDFDSHAGIVFAFNRIDLLAATDRDWAQGVLNLIECHSRQYMLFGDRLLGLAQSDDAEIHFDPVGACPVMWNNEEWLNANRGL